MKESGTAGTDREDEARATVLHIADDMDSLEEQVADIQSFLERLSGHGSDTELQEPSQAYDSDDSQVRHVSNSTANTGAASWTTTTDSTDHEPMSVPITPEARKMPKIPKTPKTPWTQIMSDKNMQSAPTSAGTASSNKAHDAEWEEEWGPELVVAALSSTQSHASFTAAGDKENDDANAKKDGDAKDGSNVDSTTNDLDFSKATSASPDGVGDSTHLYHPANTTWIEDAPSTFKGEDSEEWAKTQSRLASKSSTSKSSPAAALERDYERDYDRFRKQLSSRMRLLEKLNRSLMRKIEELESGMAANESDKRSVMVRRKGDEAAREKLIREQAVEEYKKLLRAEDGKERKRRKMLRHEARLIEERAQREMTDIYQQSGLQVHEAAQRHHEEVFQIQQRLTSELLTIERRIQEQIQAKVWSLPTRSVEDRADKGKTRRVSFEPLGQTNTEQATQKHVSLQVPLYRTSGASGTARKPSDASQVAPEAPRSTWFSTDIQNIHPAERRTLDIHPAERQISTDLKPIAAIAPWESRDPEPPKTTLKRSSTTASRFRCLARVLRLKSVGCNDVNVVKVSKSTKGSPDRTEATANRRSSKGSFLSRCRRNSSIKPEQRSSARREMSNPVSELPAAVQQPSAPRSYHPTEHQAVPPPQRAVSSSTGFPPYFQSTPTPPRHPPFSFQLNVPPGARGSTWPPPQAQATKAHKNQMSPDYYGLPREWDRVSPLIAAATAACAAREQQEHLKRQRRHHQHHRSHHHHSSPNKNNSPSDINTPTPASRHTRSNHSRKHKHRPSTSDSASPSSPVTTVSSSTQSPAGSSSSNHADKYWPALTHLSSLPFRAHYY